MKANDNVGHSAKSSNTETAGQPGSIYWLASYPKSGNTWVRAFITNLRNEQKDPAHINELDTGAIASSREWIQDALDFDIGELSHDEVDNLRSEAYQWLSQQMDSPEYHKLHDAYTLLPCGRPLIPTQSCRGVLYIVRNPLDLAISFAHHINDSIDEAINKMAASKTLFCGGNLKLYNQLRQKLLSWSEHVNSWRYAEALNLELVRYEDMKLNPLATFTRVARFLSLPDDYKSVQQASNHCSFDKMQAQEAKTPFKEKSIEATNFFRKGIVGDWQNTLTDKQIKKIISDHKEVMEGLGYIDNLGQPIEFTDAHSQNENPLALHS